MRFSLMIFSIVACLFIHCIQLAQPKEENAETHCTPGTIRNQTKLHRRRRYLLFEKGAAISIAASAVKTLIASTPRGLNLVTEETIYYDLPSSLSIPKAETSTSSPTKSPHKVKSKGELIQKSLPTYRRYTPYYMHEYKRNVHSTMSKDDGTNSLDIEGLFFQQLETFAQIYGFNGQHCIMRVICEAQHILYPRGQSLFHDIIRIILEFSLPTIRNNKKYFTASTTVNPMDCANFYGPHCKISFLDYFTVQIYGKFM